MCVGSSARRKKPPPSNRTISSDTTASPIVAFGLSKSYHRAAEVFSGPFEMTWVNHNLCLETHFETLLCPSLRFESPEQFPIERAVVNGFRDVMHLDVLTLFKVGNRTRNFDDAVVPAPTQVELRNGGFE